VVLEVAKEKKIQIWRRDLFLDDEKLTAVLLEKKLQKLKEISQRNRQIFVIGHCHSTSRLEFIQDFIDRALADGFVLSPLSKLIQKEEVMDA
jgi:polysaccharide deacetylase 2 family uncharacterized protein YibQ